jgi:uncharacterized protein (UPF0218 family)
MATLYKLTPELRLRLKEPLGELIRGPFNKTLKALKSKVIKEKPTMIITVGDIVSGNLNKKKITSGLSIIDNKVMRKEIEPITLNTNRTLHAQNPPGTITKEALMAIQEALRANYPVKIVVEGEEDLLTLAAILYAPENSFVVYGQPLEGIVVVRVTEQKKREIQKILEMMENFEKLNR